MLKNALESAWNWQHLYAELPANCYSRVNPTPVRRPKLFVFNNLLASELGLEGLSAIEPETLAEVFSGNRVPTGAQPLAMAYAGHQFGNFVVLGDGRAILLGEHVDNFGRRHDIQLKGSGVTPYSRRGDGRAALGPMLREYLISEAMAALGIPTTRSLAVAETGESVQRDQSLPGAVLVRTAASHLRVGTFELFAARKDTEALEALLAQTITRHFPELADELIDPDTDKAISMAEEALAVFPDTFATEWLQRMAQKIGIEKPEPADKALVDDWLALLEKHRLDFTNAFRALSGDQNPERLRLNHSDFGAWQERLNARFDSAGISPSAAQQVRDTTNPRHIPRNHAVEKALEAAVDGDSAPFNRALAVLRRPFDNSTDNNTFSSTPNEGEQVYTTFCGT